MPNLLTRSEEFSNSAWFKLNAVVTENATDDPFGSTNADSIADNTTNGEHSARQLFNDKRGVVERWTASAFLKANSITIARVLLGDIGTADSAVSNFNLLGGTSFGVSVSGGFSAPIGGIIPMGNGWHRCSITALTNADAVVSMRMICVSSGTASYVGVGESFYATGANLEPGLLGRYIPTVADRVPIDHRLARVNRTSKRSQF